MESKKLYWVIIDYDYLDYLKKIEPRIPNYNYGSYHIKPFYGTLLEKNGLCYVSQVNHYNPEKHNHIPTSLDFQKIYDFQYKKMISTTNLNFMFPVPKNMITKLELEYRNIEDYMSFKSPKAKYNQINLLKKILNGLNHADLSHRANIIQDKVQLDPSSKLASRCFDFDKLERAAICYNKQEQDITEMANKIYCDESILIKL